MCVGEGVAARILIVFPLGYYCAVQPLATSAWMHSKRDTSNRVASHWYRDKPGLDLIVVCDALNERLIGSVRLRLQRGRLCVRSCRFVAWLLTGKAITVFPLCRGPLYRRSATVTNK
jgi:hypothetical protein